MSPLLSPSPERTSAKIGTNISTPLVVPSERRTWGDCANPTTATSRISRPRCARPAPPVRAFGSLGTRRSQVLLEGVVVGVRLGGGPEMRDVLQAGDPFLAGFPDGLDPHPHPDVLGRAVEDEVEERDVGAVEQDVGADVRRRDL